MPLSIDDLIDRLAASKLLSADDARSVLSSLAESDRPADGESFAALLVKSSKLTSFQAQRLMDGQPESLLLGNYVLLDRIGRGGMGDVFKAEHRRMKRVVALKVVKPEILDSPTALKRFQREVETVAKLDHPNIVVAHDADEAHGVNFLVMQFVDGRDLSSVVKTNGPLPIARAVDCILQAARGLSYAHDQGIVHRDIKPGNLLLDKKGAVKILDLGLATLMGREAGRDESLTASEMIVGTLDYMAPEQAHNSKLADPRSDIYSLGMTLYFLLTGRPAYETESVIEKLLAHREKPAPSLASGRPGTDAQRWSPPGNIISALNAIFQKMVAKQPADRYQSMAEVATALEAFQKTHSGVSDSTMLPFSDATSAWVRSSEAGNLTQRHRGTEKSAGALAEAVVVDPASATHVDQTASLVSPLSTTTETLRKPSVVGTVPVLSPPVVTPAKGLGVRPSYLLIAAVAAVLLLVSFGVWFARRPFSPRGDAVETAVAVTGLPVSGPADQSGVPSNFQKPKSTPLAARPAPGESIDFEHGYSGKANASPTPQSEIRNPQSPPLPGFALEFNGKDSYVDLPTLRYDGSHPITLEATIHMHRTRPQGVVIGDTQILPSSPRFALSGLAIYFPNAGPYGAGRGSFSLSATRGDTNVFTSAPVIPSYMTIAAVLQGSTAHLFVDGKLQNSSELPGRYKPSPLAFLVGTRAPTNSVPLSSAFQGVIDELRVSKIARYAADFTPQSRFDLDADTLALYHFDEGDGDILTDASGNNHHGKIVNAEWVPGIAAGSAAAK